MSARLIVNADDFGLTRGINRAIKELHEAGVLSSATLMATGSAFDHAVAIARELPSLGVGCHIVLVDGTPVSPPHKISTLLGSDGKSFRTSLTHFVSDLLLGKVDEDQIVGEAIAQVQKLRNAGIGITHLDTHKHTHIFPQVARPLLRVALETSINFIRYPFEPLFALRLSRGDWKRRTQLTVLNSFRPAFKRLMAKKLTTQGTLGIAATGSLNETTLHELLSALPNNSSYELVCHPGYLDSDLDRIPTRLRQHREVERQVLLSVMPKILSLPQPPELIHYGNLKP